MATVLDHRTRASTGALCPGDQKTELTGSTIPTPSHSGRRARLGDELQPQRQRRHSVTELRASTGALIQVDLKPRLYHNWVVDMPFWCIWRGCTSSLTFVTRDVTLCYPGRKQDCIPRPSTHTP